VANPNEIKLLRVLVPVKDIHQLQHGKTLVRPDLFFRFLQEKFYSMKWKTEKQRTPVPLPAVGHLYSDGKNHWLPLVWHHPEWPLPYEKTRPTPIGPFHPREQLLHFVVQKCLRPIKNQIQNL
jgi:hypothetical protein